MGMDATAQIIIGRVFDSYDEASEFWDQHHLNADTETLKVDIHQYYQESELVILGIQVARACYAKQITYDLPARMAEATDLMTFVFGVSFKKDVYLVAEYL